MAAKKRKNPYIPGIAAMNFEPDYDWSKEESETLFKNKNQSEDKQHHLSFSLVGSLHPKQQAK